MAITLQQETTEYIYVGVTGTPPSDGGELAFLAAGSRPQEQDWEEAELVSGEGHPLWDDARASGAAGDYYVAVLVGGYQNAGVVLSPGDYQVWVRLTDTTERPVRIAPEALEVA